ncbi:MAG: hypothetical protein A2Y67_01155 [Candidatus Buchananbacteria bacterium RBG_13_39_9]|uniref:Uncharacterized protein n=1 Tax=Candidatus Buchananbacteria bacterium RBG_13_39_9 TaxID=1797531 RepID=A0A1G1XMH2_9BACT|nr:MAG: hypothetical protein A2Y67_01155 [Candidatus Buchananbacteria bacterium RBG_13_39_9]
MAKTILIIVIFIILTVLIAYIATAFLVPEQKIRYNDCLLLQNIKTKAVDCFGCANNICKDATADWMIYENQAIGIPYACFKNESGCQLAQ